MKRISNRELLDLGLGSEIRIIWNNSSNHDKDEEHYGVVFENKIGWKD